MKSVKRKMEFIPFSEIKCPNYGSFITNTVIGFQFVDGILFWSG